jgi:hypothetical protein
MQIYYVGVVKIRSTKIVKYINNITFKLCFTIIIHILYLKKKNNGEF